MQATSKAHATPWNLLLPNLSTLHGVWKGSSLVRYLSTVKPKLLLANPVQHCFIPGLYSGIFAIYLQHRGSQQGTNRANNILFYALWVLYALTTATFIVDMLELHWIIDMTVSMDYHRFLNLFRLILQTIEILYHLQIIEVTLFALCDVIAQTILVRTTDNGYHHSSNSSKDISMLDRLGLQHSCCYRSIILGIRILRYINLSSFSVSF